MLNWNVSFTEYHRPLCTNDREGLLCKILLITSVSPSATRCACQPLQITTAIKHRVEPTPSPPQPTLSALSECPYLSLTVHLYPLIQHWAKTARHIVNVWRRSSASFSYFTALPSSPPPAFFSLGNLSILYVFWASFGRPKYFRYHAGCTQAAVPIVPELPVAPPHRQDCVKP